MKMRTVSDIIQLWPRSADLARELDVSPPRLSDWKNRNSIPAAYWRDLIRAARRHGHPEVTAELLVDLHAREQPMEQNGFGEEERPWTEPAAPSAPPGEPVGTGHFSRFKHLRRSNFASIEEINEHIRALREEWDHR
jgi:hypothetical protein